MSAPDVNVERQKARHKTMVRGLWIGAFVAVVVVAVIFGTDISPTALIPADN